MVLLWNHRLDLTVEQLLSTCNMSSLDMSCLNPWPFHPLTNALLKGLVSLNKSLLLTPENTAKKETCGFWVGIPTNCGAWGLPTNCWCLLPSLSRPCQNRSSSPPDLPAPSGQTPGPQLVRAGQTTTVKVTVCRVCQTIWRPNLEMNSSSSISIDSHWAKSLAPLVSGRILADSWDMFPWVGIRAYFQDWNSSL